MTAHRVIIDYDRRRVTAYTPDSDCFMFQRDKQDALPQVVYDSRWHMQLMGWLASITLENEARQDLGLPQAICEYEDVFPDELPQAPKTC